MSEEFGTSQAQDDQAVQPAPTESSQTSTPQADAKKLGGSDLAATAISIVLVKLLGLIGALICYGGYWAVRALSKSKLSVAAKVILSIVLSITFFVLMVVYIYAAALLRAQM